jgi:hypothetical protein
MLPRLVSVPINSQETQIMPATADAVLVNRIVKLYFMGVLSRSEAATKLMTEFGYTIGRIQGILPIAEAEAADQLRS